MLIQELISELNLENYTCEFKARLTTGLDKNGEDNEVKWLKELVAFANTGGGSLFIGVNDKTHEIESMSHQEVDQAVQLLYKKIEERIEPAIYPKIKELEINDSKPSRYILRVDVPQSKTTPVYVHINGVPACYIRQFGMAKIASPEQIAQLVIKSSKASYDTLETEDKYNAKNFSKLAGEYKKISKGKELNEKILESIGFINLNGNLARGATLFKDDCNDEITLAKCTLYPEYDKGSDSVLAAESFKGCLLDVIQNVMAFIKNHSTTGYKKTPTSRVDILSFPERALFEGIINAFAHRNYFIFGSEVQFNIFKDRLEIVSPGSLLDGRAMVNEKNIQSIQPRRRNELICSIFELIHWMEAKGTGFDKIAEEYLSADEKHKPFVSSDDNSFSLTLPDLTFEPGAIGVDNPYPEIHLRRNIASNYDEKILSCCYYKERSLIEIASFLGISASTHLRKDILEKLCEADYLFVRQSGKSFLYQTNRKTINK